MPVLPCGWAPPPPAPEAEPPSVWVEGEAPERWMEWKRQSARYARLLEASCCATTADHAGMAAARERLLFNLLFNLIV